MDRPIPDSYWVVPGRLLAGEYPGALNPDAAQDRLRRFLDAGIILFLDLTQAGEYGLEPYAPLLRGQAEHRRMPIADLSTPTAAEMARILDAIDDALEAGQVVYVHCYGGIGRTGTVVGCYLVRHGLSGQEALAEIARLRQGTPDGWKDSPETAAQRAMVLEYGRTPSAPVL